MTWKERIVLTAILLALACGLSFLYWPRDAKGQCNIPDGEVLEYPGGNCVVFNRKQARYLGVPKRLKVRTLNACIDDRHKHILVFGTGKRRGDLLCSGSGSVHGQDFEACGLIW